MQVQRDTGRNPASEREQVEILFTEWDSMCVSFSPAAASPAPCRNPGRQNAHIEDFCRSLGDWIAVSE